MAKVEKRVKKVKKIMFVGQLHSDFPRKPYKIIYHSKGESFLDSNPKRNLKSVCKQQSYRPLSTQKYEKPVF